MRIVGCARILRQNDVTFHAVIAAVAVDDLAGAFAPGAGGCDRADSGDILWVLCRVGAGAAGLGQLFVPAVGGGSMAGRAAV